MKSVYNPIVRDIPVYFLITVLTGCNAGTPVKDTPAEEQEYEFVYPPAPETPRFYYETSFFHSGQLKGKSEEDSWREFLTGESAAQSGEGLSKPFDVTSCGGRVYISDTVRRHVAVFDLNSKTYFVIGEKEPGLLRKPLGLDSDSECNLYVADITLGTVVIYRADGSYKKSIGTHDWFHRLSHIAVDSQGQRLYAVDTGGVQTDEHRVRVFDIASGDHLFDIGTRGTEEGQFNLPKDINIGANGDIHVVDAGNFRVQVFDNKGNFKHAFGSVGNRTGQFSRPKGIASDADGNIYVSDVSLANFQIFNAQGELLMFIGNRTKENQPAGYMLPSGIDVDMDGRVYFTDQFFRKVDVFRPAALPKDGGVLGRLLYSDVKSDTK